LDWISIRKVSHRVGVSKVNSPTLSEPGAAGSVRLVGAPMRRLVESSSFFSFRHYRVASVSRGFISNFYSNSGESWDSVPVSVQY